MRTSGVDLLRSGRVPHARPITARAASAQVPQSDNSHNTAVNSRPMLRMRRGDDVG
jgi:hypothetical protein